MLPLMAVRLSPTNNVTQSPKMCACLHVKHLYVRPELLTSRVQYKQRHSLPGQEVTLTSFLRGRLAQTGSTRGPMTEGNSGHMTPTV